MTDRELLELAAKAAGIALRWSSDADLQPRRIDDDSWVTWHPLTEDGDALRLAVKLDIAILPGSRAQIGFPYGPIFGEDSLIYGSTRRAIVRAAAEIGRAKQ